MVASLKLSNIRVDGLFLNADAGSDTVPFRNCRFKHDIFDNIDNNNPNGKNDVSFLDEALYKERFAIERTNAGAFRNKKIASESSKYHCFLYYST